MPVIPVDQLDDPRHPLLADYANVREKQLAEEFRERGALGPPGWSPGAFPVAPLGKFMVEGDLVLRRLLESPFPLISLLVTPTRLDALADIRPAIDPAVPIFVIPPPRLEALVGFNLHRGLLAIAARRPPLALADVLARAAGRPLLVLESLANHDNVGACFRNAAAFGAAGIILSPDSADPLYRKSTRVAMGHTLTLPFARVGIGPGSPRDHWLDDLKPLRAAGYTLAALSPRGTPIRAFMAARPPAAPLAWLVGAEGPGLSNAALAAADAGVSIPMTPGVDSLNVAVATAIALEHTAATAATAPPRSLDPSIPLIPRSLDPSIPPYHPPAVLVRMHMEPAPGPLTAPGF